MSKYASEMHLVYLSYTLAVLHQYKHVGKIDF